MTSSKSINFHENTIFSLQKYKKLSKSISLILFSAITHIIAELELEIQYYPLIFPVFPQMGHISRYKKKKNRENRDKIAKTGKIGKKLT